MKYPRTANLMLDGGMIMMGLGGIGFAVAMLGMLQGETYLWLSLAVLLVGFTAFAASKIVSKMKGDSMSADCGGPRLKLVK